MRGAESVIDVNIAELGEAGTEGFHFFRIGLELGTVFELYLALFLDVEAEVLQQDHVARLGLGAGGLNFRADAVVEELHRLAEQLRERIGDGLEGKFLDALAVRTAKVAHQNHRRTLVERVFDGRQRRLNALGVGDGTGGFVLRDVEIHADQGAFALQVEIFNKQFGHKLNWDVFASQTRPAILSKVVRQ